MDVNLQGSGDDANKMTTDSNGDGSPEVSEVPDSSDEDDMTTDTPTFVMIVPVPEPAT